jgi:carbonic anhydrase
MVTLFNHFHTGEARVKRPFTKIAVFSVLLLSLLGRSETWAEGPTDVSADEALRRLKAGNERFAAGKATHEHQQAAWRAQVAKGQKPFAVVVCCSDSREPPEIVYDQGLGDLFVIRTAGNVVDDIGIGSIEYAVEHFDTRLIVVLGHSQCGAVDAAVSGGEAHGHIRAVVDAIKPAVDKVKNEPGNRIENAVRSNVRETVERLRTTGPLLPDRIKAGKLKIVGECYDLERGRIEPVE